MAFFLADGEGSDCHSVQSWHQRATAVLKPYLRALFALSSMRCCPENLILPHSHGECDIHLYSGSRGPASIPTCLPSLGNTASNSFPLFPLRAGTACFNPSCEEIPVAAVFLSPPIPPGLFFGPLHPSSLETLVHSTQIRSGHPKEPDWDRGGVRSHACHAHHAPSHPMSNAPHAPGFAAQLCSDLVGRCHPRQLAASPPARSWEGPGKSGDASSVQRLRVP